MLVQNFGRNVAFRPSRWIEPASVEELLVQLNALPVDVPVRVVAAGHSWSPLIETAGASVSLSRLGRVVVSEDERGPLAEIQAGCRIKRALRELNRLGLTLPALGLVTEQFLAGAIATGTHGSGRPSLSHFVESLTIVRFDPQQQRWEQAEIAGGDDLLAARCSLGCLGVVTSIRLRPRPQYDVIEHFAGYSSLSEVLSRVDEFPLQQFYLSPHRWDWIAQHRVIREGHRGRSLAARLYRVYFHLTFDWGLHLGIKFCAGLCRSRRLVRGLFRLLPLFVVRGWRVADRSDCQLIMEHELFRHVETELFVRESQVEAASRFLIAVLQIADGADLSAAAEFLPALEHAGLTQGLTDLRGSYTHHYPICYRRVLPDDALISMTAHSDEPWYAVSLIVMSGPREPFYRLMQFLAESMTALFEARLHWGKHLPAVERYAERSYPRLPEFLEVLQRWDPAGRMQNPFTQRMLGVDDRESVPTPPASGPARDQAGTT